MIMGMPFSGSVALLKYDMSKATDSEIIEEIHANLQAVNAMADDYRRKDDKEMARLKGIEQDVIAFRRLLKTE